MRKTALLLFDIDGTLLTGAGAGEASLRRGFEEAFGLNEDLHGIEIAGRTDSGIARALFAKHALPETPENFEKFFSGYLRNLRRELPARSGALLPGIVDLLQTLAALPHVAL
ncbi:MAG: Phosphoglycolate phosphatase [Verrucomicrobiota bacterium]|jgi:phosphoglycolate phosphatase-like HAD superfamily hydrolase